jgi:hypothetical protein
MPFSVLYHRKPKTPINNRVSGYGQKTKKSGRLKVLFLKLPVSE